MSETDFLEITYNAIAGHGFDADNTIACVGVCRDELCRSLVWAVRDVWGEAFNFSGLGGLLTLGIAGFRAAHYHAPIYNGRERYVYIIMPHIGISEDGDFGKCLREGRHGSSAACGALSAMLEEFRTGTLDLSVNNDNIEYSLLKQHLTPRLLGKGLDTDSLDIATLTLAMSNLITDDLERMIELTVDKEVADYGVLTGVQIHRPISGSMVWINKGYVCVEGERRELELELPNL
ncbi:MAG: hypothetical protein GY811_02940 [Myxococcales bacterium]|nr:hypothetical protein [Myxococcales bacterium]